MHGTEICFLCSAYDVPRLCSSGTTCMRGTDVGLGDCRVAAVGRWVTEARGSKWVVRGLVYV